MFVYDSFEELGGSNNAIRLLTIHPAIHIDDAIQCKLTAHHLNQSNNMFMEEMLCTVCPSQGCKFPRPKYEALSYVWGSHQDQVDIAVNGETFRVTRSLDAALRGLRHLHTERIMWIDAVCIDQGNAAEKNVQVSLMYLIYEQAEQVVAWLGSNSEMGDLAIQTVKEMGGSEDELVEGYDDGITPIQMIPKVPESAPRLGQVLKENGKRWASIQWLMTNPWWQRAWIVQEGSYAQHLRFQISRESFVLDSLENIIRCRDYRMAYDDEATAYSKTFRPLATLLLERGNLHSQFREWGYRQTQPLLALLSRYDYCKASDPRDNIFALLNLADQDQLGFRPDYTKEVKSVYQDTVEAIVKHDKSLNILHCVNRAMECSKLGEILPSWVPDFSTGMVFCPLVLPTEGNGDFSAAGDTKVDVTFVHDDPQDELHSPGQVFAVVAEVFETLSAASFEDGSWEEVVRGWVPRARHLASESDEVFEEMIIRTLLSDKADYNSRRLTDGEFEEVKESFRIWVQGNQGQDPTAEVSNPHDPDSAKSDDLQDEHSSSSNADPTFESHWQSLGVASIVEAEGLEHSEFKKYVRKKHEEKMILKQEAEEREARMKGQKLQIQDYLKLRLMGWTLAFSSNGHAALVPHTTQTGDEFAVLKGFSVPVVLRACPDDQPGGLTRRFQFVGPCYVYGVMNGNEEVVSALKTDASTFVVV